MIIDKCFPSTFIVGQDICNFGLLLNSKAHFLIKEALRQSDGITFQPLLLSPFQLGMLQTIHEKKAHMYAAACGEGV